MTKNLDKKISLRLDQDRYRLLEQIAEKQGCSVSLVLRHLVIRFLEQEQRFQQPGAGV